MRRNFFDKRIPTLLGLIVITAGILLTTFLVRSGTLFDIKATAGQEPKDVEITNISDVAFTVSYITDDSVVGTINYGTDPSLLDKLVLDDRDQLSQSVNKYSMHSVSVKGLVPETTYYFQINSGDQIYFNNDSLYNIQTGSYIEKDPSSQNPISGKVIGPDGLAPSEGLVFVSVSKSQKLSTYLKSDGTYTIPLNSLRNETLNDYLNFSWDSIINIEVFSDNLFSKVSVSASEVNPVPAIILSGNYDFSSSKSENSPFKKPKKTAFPTVGSISTLTKTPTPSTKITPVPTESPSPEITPTPTIHPAGNSSVIITTVARTSSLVRELILFLLTRGNISL